MPRLVPNQLVATLWDHLLPVEVQELPADLLRIDALLSDPALLDPFRSHWDHTALHNGRSTIPMAVYLRVTVIKHRTGWGYETPMQQVSDSIHLRRFCLTPLRQRVPDESTIRKMTRRLGSEVVDGLIRALILKTQRERRFQARALRCDSTVTEADVRYPTDAGLCADAVRRLAQSARRVRSLADPGARPIRRGKLARPNEFGFIVQFTELTSHTQRGARGLILPPKLRAGSTHENTLLPETVGELLGLSLTPKEAVFDAGFGAQAASEAIRPVGSQVFMSGKTKCTAKQTGPAAGS